MFKCQVLPSSSSPGSHRKPTNREGKKLGGHQMKPFTVTWLGIIYVEEPFHLGRLLNPPYQTRKTFWDKDHGEDGLVMDDIDDADKDIDDDADADDDDNDERTCHWQKVELSPGVRGLQLSSQQSPVYCIYMSLSSSPPVSWSSSSSSWTLFCGLWPSTIWYPHIQIHIHQKIKPATQSSHTHVHTSRQDSVSAHTLCCSPPLRSWWLSLDLVIIMLVLSWQWYQPW